MLVRSVGICRHQLFNAKEQEGQFAVCADDAGARTVKFCLDLRQHPTGEAYHPPVCHTDTINSSQLLITLC